MSPLAQQVLERFESGDTLERERLALSANYDSVGRVLRELVRQGKLVRVGRGRYRKASGKAAPSSASILERIERRVAGARNRNVFLRRDFAELGSYDAVGRALRQLTQRGRLVQIGYGLYAKADRSPLTGKPAPVVGIKRLASEALSRLGKTMEESSFSKAYSTGRSTQVPTGRTIAVKGRVRRRIGYDGKYVSFERTR
ncbi:MAG TPA: hypothetical protein VF631_02050 [Allosphingosinicella sp.]|jgi:hypothetical protein|uniref:hypothetical protein n=1 Tax=Allosphingosinicella sp. TaxID=2823234 RepID=UPI002F288B72